MARKKYDLSLGVLLILLAAGSRLMPFMPPNFSMITGLCLFSGFLFRGQWLSVALPLAALFLSDAFLGFYAGMPWVYASFFMVVLLGQQIRSSPLVQVPIAALASSLLFFVVTNFGVWSGGALYPKTAAGLIQCYTMALPFFRNSLISDLLSSAVIFSLYFGMSRLTIFWQSRQST